MALNGSDLVAEATREHILNTARRLGYRVNRTASSLASGKTGLLGLVLPDLRNPFFDFMAHALQEAAAERSLVLLLALASDTMTASAVVESMLSMRVEGLILISPVVDDESIRRLGEECPTCLVGRASVGGAVDTVRLDEDAAADMVIEHLSSRGARRLAYCAPQDDPVMGERFRALVGAAERQGMELARLDVAKTSEGWLRRLASSGGLGIVTHNDMVALDVDAALRTASLPVPLVSYDDTYLARRDEFSFTSVEQPAPLMAGEAVRLLRERCESLGEVGVAGRIVTVPPVLAVRRSSRR